MYKGFYVVLGFLLATAVEAKLIYVDASSPYDPGTGTVNDPYRHIQDGINGAVDGDEVEIAEGLYVGTGNRDLDFGQGLAAGQSRAITVRSSDPNDLDVVVHTIIEPEGAGRGFYFYRYEGHDSVVAGLTIRNGHTGDKGGGAACYESSPTFINCVFEDNTSNLHGGGIYALNSTTRLTGCIIRGNSALLDGGGVECWASEPNIVNCLFYDNEASYGSGGAMDCFHQCEITLTNCTFVANSSMVYGGAVYLSGSIAVMKNNILWDDTTVNGQEVALGAYNGDVSSLSIDYCNIEGLQAGINTDPSCVLDWGDGNIDVDPCFVCYDLQGDPGDWDFHLQSRYGRFDPLTQQWHEDSNLSGCIDAGDVGSDYGEEPWPNGKRINIGCYGGTGQASMNGNMADFNINGIVDLNDFAAFQNQWLQGGDKIEDLTGNGMVDIEDLALFVENWLWQRQD